MAKQISFNRYYTVPVALTGGINENVGSLELQPGELIDCRNYMLTSGGYGGYISTAGYERIDGTYIPSHFESYLLTVDNCERDVLKDDVLIGTPSGAVAVALGNSVTVSGDISLGTARLVIEALIDVGTLQSGDTLVNGIGIVGTITYPAILYGGNQENHLALEYARSQVLEVPGEGDILGLHVFKGLVYAFRKHVGLATIGMYVSFNGWSEVDTSTDPIIYSVGKHNFKFSNYNFNYSSDTFSMYWVDGVNKCRTYDGNTVATITNTSKIGTDNPELLATHNQMLFLTYKGGYLMGNGTPGFPADWTAPVEYGLGHEITNLVAGVASSLIILLDEGIQVLHGTSELDFKMEVYSTQSGAYLNTAQRLLGTVYMVDDRGLTTLEAVDAYGDYTANSISQKFKDSLLGKDRSILRTSTSRDFNQYRVHFNDGESIYVSFEGKELKGATMIKFPDPVVTVATGEDVEGVPITVFSSYGSGYVYLMDSGPSFDGGEILATMKTAFHHYGSPRSYKSFKRLTAEIRGEAGQTFLMRGNLDYQESGTAPNIWNLVAAKDTIYSETSIWGRAIYGTFVWGAGIATNRVVAYLVGVGTNIGFNIISSEKYRGQHIIQNLVVDYELLQRSV